MTRPLPPITLLRPPDPKATSGAAERTGQLLVTALKSFGVECVLKSVKSGPTVTRYELLPGWGVRIKEITNLTEDLSLAMQVSSLRIIAPVPGKGVIGIEIPNESPQAVSLYSIVDSKEFRDPKNVLPIALGVTLEGDVIVADLAKMPHLLVAGTTGSGKSVGINGIITSLLLRYTADELRFLFIDPKVVELSIYNGLPHLRHPVIVHPKAATEALAWAVEEMEQRYALLASNQCRNIVEFNAKKGPREKGAILSFQASLPYIVIIIDEFADLMMVAAKECETMVTRIAQKARAVGIHLILATQRPSTDVITGLIKANFPSRIAFRVFSSVDSRIILNVSGAEKLIGNGDMLLTRAPNPDPIRLQGAYVSTDETIALMKWFKDNPMIMPAEPNILQIKEGGEEGDELSAILGRAAKVVAENKKCNVAILKYLLNLRLAQAQEVLDELIARGNVTADPDEEGYYYAAQ